MPNDRSYYVFTDTLANIRFFLSFPSVSNDSVTNPANDTSIYTKFYHPTLKSYSYNDYHEFLKIVATLLMYYFV